MTASRVNLRELYGADIYQRALERAAAQSEDLHLWMYEALLIATASHGQHTICDCPLRDQPLPRQIQHLSHKLGQQLDTAAIAGVDPCLLIVTRSAHEAAMEALGGEPNV